MKIHPPILTNRQDQDQVLRLQHAALRRAGDEARHQIPSQNRWIAPDTVPLLDSLLFNEKHHQETMASVKQVSVKREEEFVQHA